MSDSKDNFVMSSKKTGNSVQEDTSTNQDDIWDDTLLIKAYDHAFKLSQQNCSKLSQNSENNAKLKGKREHKWKVGDRCRCQYTEDLKYYEAEIIEISDSNGFCIVKYVGYENEEEVPLKRLRQSAGDDARMSQSKQALEDYGIQNDVETEKSVHSNVGQPGTQPGTQPEKQRPSSSKKEQLRNRSFIFKNTGVPLHFPLHFPFPYIGSSIIPPPPPPHLFNQLKQQDDQDDLETEAMSAMLMSWYMSGYHTGYYEGLKMAKNQ